MGGKRDEDNLGRRLALNNPCRSTRLLQYMAVISFVILTGCTTVHEYKPGESVEIDRYIEQIKTKDAALIQLQAVLPQANMLHLNGCWFFRTVIADKKATADKSGLHAEAEGPSFTEERREFFSEWDRMRYQAGMGGTYRVKVYYKHLGGGLVKADVPFTGYHHVLYGQYSPLTRSDWKSRYYVSFPFGEFTSDPVELYWRALNTTDITFAMNAAEYTNYCRIEFSEQDHAYRAAASLVILGR